MENPDTPAPAPAKPIPVRDLISICPVESPSDVPAESAVWAILAEAAHGYGLLILGLDARTPANAQRFPASLEKIIHEFHDRIAILLSPASHRGSPTAKLEKILVPTTGADYSRFGAEVAVAIARGCGAAITALHVSTPPRENELLRRPDQRLRPGRALLADIVALGKREGVRVTSRTVASPAKDDAILRQARLGGHQLIVLGTSAWSGDPLHFGQSTAAIIASATCPVLIVKS